MKSSRKRLVFIAAACLGLPLLTLLCVEVLLRRADYGFEASYFKTEIVGGKRRWVENDRFGYRFFPPQLARSPAPTIVDPIKPKGVIRLVLFGESAAMGDPKPGLGFGRYLEVLLEEAFPSTKFEVISVAMTAINSHAILPIAKQCKDLNADYWLLYMGNNEMPGPFGATSVFGIQAWHWRWVRTSLWLQQFRIGQAFIQLGREWRAKKGLDPSWQGLRMFVGSEIPPNDPRRERVYANFQANLESILNCGVQSGARVFVSSVGSNLKDCAPFASLSSHQQSPTQKAEFDKGVKLVSEHFGRREWKQALERCEQLISILPDFAETYFVAGLCQKQLNLGEAAEKAFIKARDLDALPFRCDSRLNEIARDSASRAGERVHWLNGSELLSKDVASQAGSGFETFYEHVHLNLDGNYRLARIFANSLEPYLTNQISSIKAGEWVSQEHCDGRLGVTDWTRASCWESMYLRILDAPFTNQANHSLHKTIMRQKLTEYRAKTVPGAIEDAKFSYEQALTRRPQDHWIRQEFAGFLEVAGMNTEALREWEMVRDLLPHHFLSYFQIGRINGQLRNLQVAKASLNKALAIRPGLIEAMLELGKLEVQEGNHTKAKEIFLTAEKLRPTEASIQIQMAHVLAAQGDRSGAVVRLRKAVEMRANQWESRYLLGVELAAQEQVQEASELFASAAALRPEHALTRFNLGVALARSGRMQEAKTQLTEALRLDPQNSQAQEMLNKIDQTKFR